MTTASVSAFTDYPDSVMRPVQVLSFDGNKYAQVRHADGREESVKAGYVYADSTTRRHLNDLQWHVLAGGQRHTYKRRLRKTTYRLAGTDVNNHEGMYFEEVEYDTKAAAVRAAAVAAAAHDEEVLVLATVRTHNSTSFNCREIVVTPQGLAFELRRHLHQKYLRGYGKR